MIVVKIGGSLAIGDKGPDKKYMKRLIPVAKRVLSREKTIFAIGGGRLVRNYISSIDTFLPDRKQEEVIIELLRANVKFFSSVLGIKPFYVMRDVRRASGVIGGIAPGRSTDANAAYVAKLTGARMLVKMTNVNGIYDRDPNKFRGAKKLDVVKFCDLKKYSSGGRPGSYGILDRKAMGIISKNMISTCLISGNPPSNLLKALRGEKIGTLIC